MCELFQRRLYLGSGGGSNYAYAPDVGDPETVDLRQGVEVVAFSYSMKLDYA